MSAFVCILRRDGSPVEPRLLHRLAEPLAPWGDTTATLCRGPLGVAVRHRDGSGEQQALRENPVSGRVVAVAGSLRWPGGGEAPAGASGDWGVATAGPEEAAADPGQGIPPSADPRRLIDAGLLIDPERLAGATGSFALLVADPVSGRLLLATDHLGSLPLHYVLDRERLVAATDPAALLAHPAVSADPDPAAVARFLGFRFPHGQGSFFRDVRSLPPGHRLEVGPEAAEARQYWRFRRLEAAPDRPAESLAEDFLHRLERSVADRTAGTDAGRVGLSLSGGLDSTAVAAVAPRGVRAFSWTLETTLQGDERPRVEAVAHHLDLDVTWVRGDGLYPLGRDFERRFVHPGSPFLNPFAALKSRLYATAREAGCERMLVGDGGDALYGAREYWLRDLLAHRQPGALAGLAGAVGGALRGDPFDRRALRRLLPDGGLLERGARRLRRDSPWLTPWARAALPPPAHSPILPPPGSLRHELAVGAKNAELAREERRLFALCGLERCDPFWSWPLLEAAIQLPAWWYHRGRRSKPLTRLALRGRLPEAVLEAPRGGLLGTFFLRGLELHGDRVRETVFRHPRSDWQRHVRRDRVEPHLADTRTVTFGHTILWRVIGYELWWRRLEGAGP